MVQGPLSMAKALAEAYPGFEVVVSRSEYADPDGNPVMVNDGATQIVTVGLKGKYVGIIGLFPPDKGKAPATRYHRHSLSANRLHNAEPMRVLIDEEMQSQLKALGIVENIVRHVNVEAPAGSTYVGAVGCKSCHPNTFARWEGTGHAKAYEPLVHNPKDPKRKREFDAECISCHTTGFTYNSGWVSAEKTPYLKGNQCENCHGPASKHVANPVDPEVRKSFEVALHAGAAAALLIGQRRVIAEELREFDLRRAVVLTLSFAPAAVVGYTLERPIEQRLGGPRATAIEMDAHGDQYPSKLYLTAR